MRRSGSDDNHGDLSNEGSRWSICVTLAECHEQTIESDPRIQESFHLRRTPSPAPTCGPQQTWTNLIHLLVSAKVSQAPALCRRLHGGSPRILVGSLLARAVLDHRCARLLERDVPRGAWCRRQIQVRRFPRSASAAPSTRQSQQLGWAPGP